MSHKTLPYLSYLRTTFANLAGAAGGDADAAMQIDTASYLIDYMVEQRSAALRLQARYYAAFLELVPRIEALTRSDDISVALGELQMICAAGDPSAFTLFSARIQDLQRYLFALQSPAAVTLCRSILDLESDYLRDFMEAVMAQSATANNRKASTARNARDYDEHALAAFIRGAFPQEAAVGIRHSGIISGGYSKFTVSITLSDAKELPTDIILRADAAATYGGASVMDEYRLLKIIHQHGVPVPRPLAVEETGKVFGSPFMLVEKKPGISIGHMNKLPRPNKAVCRDVAEQLAAIHRIPSAAFGDQVDNAAGRSSDKALAWIAEGLAAWKPLNMPSTAVETAFEWLRRNAALNDQAPRTLVHGDVHLANMLVDQDRISAILDWEFAHIGNPAYDLGYFYDQAIALDSWQAFLDSYGNAGAPVPSEEQLNYNILFAATRLGVMTLQAIAEFTSGAKPGMAGAMVIGHLYYENSILRITRALDRALAA